MDLGKGTCNDGDLIDGDIVDLGSHNSDKGGIDIGQDSFHCCYITFSQYSDSLLPEAKQQGEEIGSGDPANSLESAAVKPAKGSQPASNQTIFGYAHGIPPSRQIRSQRALDLV